MNSFDLKCEAVTYIRIARKSYNALYILTFIQSWLHVPPFSELRQDNSYGYDKNQSL